MYIESSNCFGRYTCIILQFSVSCPPNTAVCAVLFWYDVCSLSCHMCHCFGTNRIFDVHRIFDVPSLARFEVTVCVYLLQ
jgi:hypothetical protein